MPIVFLWEKKSYMHFSTFDMLAAVVWREIRRKLGWWYIKQKTHDVNVMFTYVKVTQVCLHTRKMTNCGFSYVASRFSFITNLLLLDFFQKTCILWLPYKKGPFYIRATLKEIRSLCIICWFLKRKGGRKNKRNYEKAREW